MWREEKVCGVYTCRVGEREGKCVVCTGGVCGVYRGSVWCV